MLIKQNKEMMIIIRLLLAVGVFYVSPAIAQDAQTVERLERMIKEQQQQLESMQRQLNQLKQIANEAKSKAEEAKTTVQAPVEKTSHFGPGAG